MNIQIIHGENGRPQFAVISIEDLNRLAKGEIEIDEEGEIWQSIPIEAGEFDDITQPHEIVSIRIDKDVGNMAAWRIYRQMTQSEAAAQAGITQAALSQIEKSRNPQRKTRELFAKIYQCQPEQLAE